MKEEKKAHQNFVDGKYAHWESLVAILYDLLAITTTFGHLSCW
jgi:hypothetical protein